MVWQFWIWFIKGVDGSRSGLSRLFFNIWALVHIIIAVFLIFWIDIPFDKAASNVLFPLASVFVALSFAWAGSAQAVMQTKEIEDLSEYMKGGLQGYVYTFQMAMLVILVTLCVWGLAALGAYNAPVLKHQCTQYFIEFILYFLACLTIRECWHVVLGSQMLLLARHHIRKAKNKN